MPHSDEYFMELAIEQAGIGQAKGEVPVGALFVEKDEVLAASGNASIERNDPTAHAEIMVMRKAAQLKGNYRLGGSVFVTLEPDRESLSYPQRYQDFFQENIEPMFSDR